MKLSLSFTGLLATLALVAAPVWAAATPDSDTSLAKRAVWTTCDSWGTSTQDQYTVYQNLWGASSGTGSQCISLDSYSAGVFAWTTTWSWSGGPYQVKSYDNIAYNIATGVQVSTISSIPTTWIWSQTSDGTPVVDVAYDLMTVATSDVSGTHTYEIMIWLGAFGGAGPISSSGSPVATPSLAGYSWKLFDGYNGSMRVFSFVATSTVTSFSGDLLVFLQYLATNNGFPTSQYLSVLQAGTEPFTGSNVVLKTTKYTVALNTGAKPSSTSTSKTSTSSTKASTSTTKTSSSSTKSSSSSKTSSTASSSGTAPVYGQCGGQNWTGPTACASGSTCTYSNAWYSQCIPS